MKQRRLGSAATAALLAIPCLLAADAHGDLIINITPDGNGMTRVTINGSYDVSSGGSVGGGGSVDTFSAQSDDGIGWNHRTTAATQSRTLLYSPHLGNDPVIRSGFFSVASQLLTDDLQLMLYDGEADARIVGYDGSYSGTLDESMHYDTLDFSIFNTGTWEWGEVGGAANDGIQLNIVPAPSAFACLALSGLVIGRRRRA